MTRGTFAIIFAGLALVTGVAAGAAAAWSAAPDSVPTASEGAPLQPPNDPCPDYLLYSVHGTNDPHGEAQGQQAFIERVKATVDPDGQSTYLWEANYPATGIPVNNGSLDLGLLLRDPLYGASRKAGQARLISDLERLRESMSCSDTRIVLFGYSQGADVIHGMYRELNQYGVSGIVLFGDPGFCALNADRTEFRGSHDRLLRGIFNQPCVGASPPENAKVWSYCDAGDIVCQWGSIWSGSHLAYGTKYGAEAGQRVGDWLLGRSPLQPGGPSDDGQVPPSGRGDGEIAPRAPVITSDPGAGGHAPGDIGGTGPSLPASARGRWTGRVTQLNNETTYVATVSLRVGEIGDEVGTGQYIYEDPSLNCSFDWILVRASEEEIIVRETVSPGTQCEDDVEITLTLTARDTLSYSFEGGNGTAELRRVD